MLFRSLAYLDTKDALSIQVHPEDDYALEHSNDYGKYESWYILDAKPGATLVAGTTINDAEQQKAAYWIKHFLEKGDMSANEIYCRLDNEGVSKRVARMVKTEMGIHCYQKKRKWYWSVQPEEGAMNGSQV